MLGSVVMWVVDMEETTVLMSWKLSRNKTHQYGLRIQVTTHYNDLHNLNGSYKEE
jgi:hypothetical protein